MLDFVIVTNKISRLTLLIELSQVKY